MIVPGTGWQPAGDYDDEDRRLDDRDGGWRWESYAACRDADPALFFPDDEPAFPPPEVRQICQRCEVSGRCLERNMTQEFGIFANTTGHQRQLLTKKIKRKRCVTCGSTDIVKTGNQRHNVCLACGMSWEII